MTALDFLLEIDGLTAGYSGIEVVHDVSFGVPRGGLAAILGANGAGKTTTLRSIVGQADVQGGAVRLDGEDIAGLPTPAIVRRGVAMCPEGRQLFPTLTVEENLRTGAIAGGSLRSARTEMATVFDVFPVLAERRSQAAGTLSGGEQQMLAIGRALMSRPRVLLIDEASLGLAPIMVDRVFELIGRINESGITVLVVEQNVAVVEQADVVFVLEKGRIAFGGPTADVGQRLREEVLVAYLGQEA